MSKFCLKEWQDIWNCCEINKLHSIYHTDGSLHIVKESFVVIALSSMHFELVILIIFIHHTMIATARPSSLFFSNCHVTEWIYHFVFHNAFYYAKNPAVNATFRTCGTMAISGENTVSVWVDDVHPASVATTGLRQSVKR